MYKTRHPRRTKRCLHLIDSENLVGLDQNEAHHSIRSVPSTRFVAALACYRRRYVDTDDCAWAAVDQGRLIGLAASWPRGALLAGFGRDGADTALIAKAEGTDPEQFDALVIASGDHAFTETAERFGAAGCHVVVLANSGSISWRLYRAADAFVADPLGAEGTKVAA